MNLEEENQKLKRENERLKDAFLAAHNNRQEVHQYEIDQARFDIAKILTKLLFSDIKRICFFDSVPNDGLKTSVKQALYELKETMNIEFEDGIFYHNASKFSSAKIIFDGYDLTNVDTYNKDWMK